MQHSVPWAEITKIDQPMLTYVSVTCFCKFVMILFTDQFSMYTQSNYFEHVQVLDWSRSVYFIFYDHQQTAYRLLSAKTMQPVDLGLIRYM